MFIKGNVMNIDAIHRYCGTKADSELKPLLGVSKSTISKWRANGIPVERQAIFEVLSKSELKADLSSFKLEQLKPSQAKKTLQPFSKSL